MSAARAVRVAALLVFASPAWAQTRPPDAAPTFPESMRTVESRPGVSQRFVLVEPPVAPVASVILFTGGEGALGFTGPGPFPRGGNFLVRNRHAFAQHGLLVAVIDVPSDHPGGYGRSRLTDGHATDVAAVIAALRERAAVPVWLVGTSKGTISAVSVAARLEKGGPDGVVISSSITRPASNAQETVYDAGVTGLRVPTLVVHHANDACVATPGSDAPSLIARVRATRKELLLFRGGAGGSSGDRACGAWAAHGYYGIDDEVVTAIAKWITATPRR